MSSEFTMFEIYLLRVISYSALILFTLLFGLHILWDFGCPQKSYSKPEISYTHTVYKKKDYTSKQSSNPQFNIIDEGYHRFPSKTYKSLHLTDDAVKEAWYKKWNQTTAEFQMNGEYICISKGMKYVECTVNESYHYACIDTSSGAIGICESSVAQMYLLHLCKGEASKKKRICGNKMNTKLCLPVKGHRTNFPIVPCTDKGRHLCLIESGPFEPCFNSEKGNDSAIDVSWDEFWSEWRPLNNEMEEEKSGTETVTLCIKDRNKIVICESSMSKSELCVGTVSGEVGICKKMNETSHILPICLSISTREIVTCGDFTVAHLCFPSAENLRPLRPCMSKSHRACLIDGRLIGHCSDVADRHAVLSTPKTTVNVINTAEERIVTKSELKRLKQLCKKDTDDKVYDCEKNSSLFPACLSIKDGNLKACSEIESEAAVGTPVCIQEYSSNLVTCERISQSNLCMHHGAKNSKLFHCKARSSFVCVTDEGSLEICSSLGKHSKDDNFSSERLNYTLPMKYGGFELMLRSVTSLCKANEENCFVRCSDEANLQVACLNLKDGKINSCKSMGYHNLSIPVCIMGSKQYVVTCGRYNMVPVCLSPKSESSKYIACGNTSNSACLYRGAIQSCNVNVSQSQAIKGHSISTRKVKFMDLPINLTHFSHKKEVYKAEMKVILSIMKDRERLCIKKGQTKRYASCMEDPTLKFVCLSPVDGKYENCENLEATELAVPLCVKKSQEVTTCGKFSKIDLCLYETVDGTVMTVCIKEGGKRSCLSEDGLFEPCTRNKSNGNNKEEEEVDKPQEHPRQAIRNKVLKMVNESHSEIMMLCIADEDKYTLTNCDEDPSFNFACIGVIEGNIRRCNSYKEDFPIPVCARVISNQLVTCDISSKAVSLCLTKKAHSSFTFPCQDPDQHSCVTKDGNLGKCVEQIYAVKLDNDIGGGHKYDDKDESAGGEKPTNVPTVGTSGPNDQEDKEEYKDNTHSNENQMDLDASRGYPLIGSQPDDESRKTSTPEETPASGAIDEKFYRIVCSNCSINHKFVIVGTPDDVLPKVEKITFQKED